MSAYRYWQGVRYVSARQPTPKGFARCGACGRSWDDSKPTAWTPAPAGRCPFEYFRGHGKEAAR